MNLDIDFKYSVLIEHLKNIFREKIDLSIILGSGLGNFAETVETSISVETSSLPGYPQSTVEGHKGYIHQARYEGKNLLLFQGRIHYYEGYKISEVLLPVFIASRLGTDKLFLSNAAGGISPELSPGDLMLNNDFIMFDIKKELSSLIGLTDLEHRNSMLNFPDKQLKEKLFTAASDENIDLKQGVYCYSKGPSYETPSEIKLMGKLGADAVGMSTAHEALFANYLGLKTAAVSLITNYAAGISPVKLSHQEVMETADSAAGYFARLLKKFITLI